MKIFALIFLECLLLTTAQAASFNCTKANTKVEKMICSDSETSKLDDDLANAYHRVVEKSADKQKVTVEQRVWLQKVRNDCQDVDCLRDVYKARINDLTTITIQANAPSKAFQSILNRVKTKTQIPILLPSALPAPIKEKDIHFAQGNGERNKYQIALYYEEGIGDAAFVGYFAGETNGKIHFKKKVPLANGVTGYFARRSCGGSCSPSNIEWRQDNVLYTIQLKLVVKTETDEERAMILAANSAIRGGAR